MESPILYLDGTIESFVFCKRGLDRRSSKYEFVVCVFFKFMWKPCLKIILTKLFQLHQKHMPGDKNLGGAGINVKCCLGLAELWADVFHGLMSLVAWDIVLITNKIDKMIK